MCSSTSPAPSLRLPHTHTLGAQAELQSFLQDWNLSEKFAFLDEAVRKAAEKQGVEAAAGKLQEE